MFQVVFLRALAVLVRGRLLEGVRSDGDKTETIREPDLSFVGWRRRSPNAAHLSKTERFGDELFLWISLGIGVGVLTAMNSECSSNMKPVCSETLSSCWLMLS